MKRVVVTAFEPFGGEHLNASLEVARALEREGVSGVRLTVVELPVVRYQASEEALRVVHELQPDVVILLGEAGGRSAVSPERVAINLDHFPIADNAGHQPQGEPIVVDGPVGYFSTLPVDAIVEAVEQAGVPAAASSSAGHFLCNRLFYRVMHALVEEGLSTRAGFIHLPYLDAQTVGKNPEPPGLPLESLVDAVRCAIAVSI